MQGVVVIIAFVVSTILLAISFWLARMTLPNSFDAWKRRRARQSPDVGASWAMGGCYMVVLNLAGLAAGVGGFLCVFGATGQAWGVATVVASGFAGVAVVLHLLSFAVYMFSPPRTR